jgi:hypothetical protein
VTGIVAAGLLNGLAFDAVAALTAAWPAAARAVASGTLIAPLALCMGMPFPLLLRALDPERAPWAWGINGCASVVGAALAAVLAVDVGFAVLVWLALGLYGVVLWSAPLAAAGAGATGRAPGG